MPDPPPLPGDRSDEPPVPPPLPGSPSYASSMESEGLGSLSVGTLPEEPTWFAALEELGFEEDTEVAVAAGLNLVAQIEGRKIRIHASRRTRTRHVGEMNYRVYHGHRIEMTAETSVCTRCAISIPRTKVERWGARTNRWVGAKEVEGACDPLTTWATEPEWAGPFLGRPDVRDEIGILFPKDDLPPNVGLKWWPGFLTYSQRLDIKKVNASRMRGWLEAVCRLAELAEASPPSREVELNRWERWSLEKPLQAGCVLIGGLFAILILLGLLFSGILVGIAFFLSR